jgi:hypothetical protein
MKGIAMKSKTGKITGLLIPFLCAMWVGGARSQEQPRLLVYNGAKLAAAKQSVLDRTDPESAALKNLLRDADKALDQKPVSVATKTQIPPSGDKRDYMSLAPYWWPDPNTKDGLPYIRKDGQVNPERNEFKDREVFGTLQGSVTTLAVAYYLTNKDVYAEHAAKMIRTFFLDSTTRMNPNMNFSEAVKGRNLGRGAGIIGLCQLPTILDAVLLIRGSKHWTNVDDSGFTSWCRLYLTWLRTSPNGIDEQDSPNNHGTWYDVQLTSLAVFTGIPDTAKRILQDAKAFRIASQIEPDGQQPKELERTRGMGYSTFNLLAMTTLATIGANVGIDLWHYETADGRSIRKAIDWMMPYYDGTKKWEHQQITEWNPDDAIRMLTAADSHLGGLYGNVAAKLAKGESTLLRARLIY